MMPKQISVTPEMSGWNDYGVFGGTFIWPTGANCPPILSRDYLSLLTLWVRSRISDFGMLMHFKWRLITPRPMLNFRATKPAALALQTQMYEAFAAGHIDTIKEICAEGLRDTLLSRIAARKPGETYQWQMLQEGRARVVSHRAAQLFPNCGLRQAVVRITSEQKLVKKINGQSANGRQGSKEVTEYFVIQKKTWKGVEQPWVVWGTTDETTIEKVEKEKAEALAAISGE